MRDYFLTHVATESEQQFYADLLDFDKQLTRLKNEIPTTMVMAEMSKPRETFVLGRGDYRNKTARVTAGVPAVLNPLPSDAPSNRLGLARWLVDPANPLTARVTVNRYWQMIFGTGLVSSSEDFGSQGEPPSHPALLDWLAVEFVESGWDVKALLKKIVMSSAYRQSSRVTPEHLEKDPGNRLLARGPRFRLSAEGIRDNALAVSGLLNPEIGGPSVYPYQPPGLWEEMAFGDVFSAQTYTPGSGKDLYRRGMYTFWKRTVPPASLATFDAPDREECRIRRALTNTPLQALVLMNDPTYVEAFPPPGAENDPRRRRPPGSAHCLGFPPRNRTRSPAGRNGRAGLYRPRAGGRLPQSPPGRPRTRHRRRIAARPQPRPRRAGRLDHRRRHDPKPRRSRHQE